MNKILIDKNPKYDNKFRICKLIGSNRKLKEYIRKVHYNVQFKELNDLLNGSGEARINYISYNIESTIRLFKRHIEPSGLIIIQKSSQLDDCQNAMWNTKFIKYKGQWYATDFIIRAWN